MKDLGSVAGTLVVVAALVATGASFAADHFDTISNPANLLEDRSHDIVDFFAFNAPDAPGALALIMNTHSGAQPLTTEFSDAIAYSFLMRTGAQAGAGNEYRITCTFDDGSPQNATCNTFQIDDSGQATQLNAGTVHAPFNDMGGGDNPAIKLFAGIRADAFFGDALGLLQMLQTNTMVDFGPRGLLPGPVRNPTAYANDLSIALQIDTATLFGQTPGYPTGNTIFRTAVETTSVPQ